MTVALPLSQDLWDQMFPDRNPFYTLEGLQEAASYYPKFARGEGQAGEDRPGEDWDVALRELAAFLANVSHETHFLKYVVELNTDNYPHYCDPDEPYGCPAGVDMYYGRGPLQLSWNFNYKAAGDALGLDLLENPMLVQEDPKIAWATALWYWNTQKGPGNYTCHDAMAGGHGFGETIRTINGPLECDGGKPEQVQSRIDLYKEYCEYLGVTPGDCLSC